MKKIPHWLKGTKKRTPISRLTQSMERQAEALTKHELEVSKQAKLQTNIAALSLFTSVITTVALLAITVLQYQTADRQVKLEYAKVEPQFDFEFKRDRISHSKELPEFITGATLKLVSGNADIETVIFSERLGFHERAVQNHWCTVQVHGIFDEKSDANFTQIGRRFIEGLSRYNDRFQISSSGVVGKVTFRDVFETLRTAHLFKGTLFSSRGDEVWYSDQPIEKAQGFYEAEVTISSVENNRGFVLKTEERIPPECEGVIEALDEIAIWSQDTPQGSRPIPFVRSKGEN